MTNYTKINSNGPKNIWFGHSYLLIFWEKFGEQAIFTTNFKSFLFRCNWIKVYQNQYDVLKQLSFPKLFWPQNECLPRQIINNSKVCFFLLIYQDSKGKQTLYQELYQNSRQISSCYNRCVCSRAAGSTVGVTNHMYTNCGSVATWVDYQGKQVNTNIACTSCHDWFHPKKNSTDETPCCVILPDWSHVNKPFYYQSERQNL